MRFHALSTTIVVLAATATGCGLTRNHLPPEVPPHAVLAPAETIWNQAPIRTALVLSGGGANGAFAAGVLQGWTQAGGRPEFDVVTGVSTGALIAPFAFLGPDYDDRIRDIYTTIGTRDVYRWRSLLTAMVWGDSLADTAPLRRRIAAEVTPDFLARVAEEHRRGRRLYVATTDLDSKQAVVWDLGAVAAGDEPGRRSLFCDVLLASCSVPAVFPPVPIDVEVDGMPRTELHVDGGVSSNAFLPPAALGIGVDETADRPFEDAAVYVIVSGKMDPHRKAVRRRFASVSGEALSGLLAGRQSDDLLKLRLMCLYAGADCHVAAIPEGVEIGVNPLEFDTPRMQDLYSVGVETGRDALWTTSGSGNSLEDRSFPRGGPKLKTVTLSESPSGERPGSPASVPPDGDGGLAARLRLERADRRGGDRR